MTWPTEHATDNRCVVAVLVILAVVNAPNIRAGFQR